MRRRIVKTINPDPNGREEPVRIEYIVACKSCFEERDQDEIVVNAPIGLPKRDEKIEVE